MGNRIIRWFTYTVVFALLPILITILFSCIMGIVSNNIDYSSEILFFTIMICATSLNDIQEIKKKIEKDFVWNLFFNVLIIFAIVCAILYGGIVFEKISSNNSILKNGILNFSIILSIISGIISFFVQILLYKIEVAK